MSGESQGLRTNGSTRGSPVLGFGYAESPGPGSVVGSFEALEPALHYLRQRPLEELIQSIKGK